mgnify:CR=1 FL=1
MNVDTIQMPRHTAWNAFQQYRAAVRQKYSETDAALMQGYRALAQGKHVLDLVAIMRQAGVDSAGRPKLAICRADAAQVACETWWNGSAEFGCGDQRRNAAAGRIIRLPPATFPRREGVRASAQVPLIPPAFRPAADLRHYSLLWEAEWVSAPKDPMLLRPLGQNLYAVLAQWELTPLEQAVLRGPSPS